MGGAYVAKPDASSTPDVPPNWNPEWPFPGPFPPGYDPELSLNMIAPTQLVPGTATSGVSVTLKDQETYATAAPTSQVIWTAEWADSGDAVSLKLSGGTEYLSSVSQAYLLSAGFYGASPDFEFNASLDDVGKTITLKAASSPFDGTYVDDEADILLVCSVPDGSEDDCLDEDNCEQIESNGTLSPCDNAVAGAYVTTYIGQFETDACDDGGGDFCTAAQRAAAVAKGAEAAAKRTAWSLAWGMYCNAVAQVDQYQCQIEEQECILAVRQQVLDGFTGCGTQQQYDDAEEAVEETQAAISALEDLKSAAESSRDGYLADANTLSEEMDSLADESMTLADVAAPPGCQYLFSAAPGTSPVTNYLCADLGPTCGSRNPLRCAVSWIVQQKWHHYTTCPTATEWHGNWNTVMGGGYTVTGKPYVTNMSGCSGVSGYECWSTNCEAPGGECPAGCGGDYSEWEVQLRQTFPSQTEEVEC